MKKERKEKKEIFESFTVEEEHDNESLIFYTAFFLII